MRETGPLPSTSSQIGSKARSASLAGPTVSRWLARELSDAAAARTIAFSKQLVVAPLTTDIATKAADYAKVHGLATADAIIFATADDARADLLTCDAHFAKLPRVVYVAKGSQ